MSTLTRTQPRYWTIVQYISTLQECTATSTASKPSSTVWSTEVAITAETQIGFIGLGNIGRGAAANLVRAGHHVVVADLDPAKVASIVDLGGIGAESHLDVANGADVIFTSLPGPAQIEAIGVGEGGQKGILSALSPGATWVELSTNDLPTARRLQIAACEVDVRLVDAPVSGGPEGAADGTLSIFVGGDADDVDEIRPLLEVIGKKVDHVGGHGAGLTAKIAQVTLCYTQTITLIEALLLGVKGGVDPATMLDLIQNSAGRSYVAETYGPEILAGTYDASFPLGHAAKDMRLALELADAVGVDLPFMRDVRDLYERSQAEYGAQAPHLLAAQLIERRNDLILHQHLKDNTP